MGASNTYVDQLWASGTLPTTSPDHSWNQGASDPIYTLVREEPLYSRIQRQLGYEDAYEFETDSETEFRHLELSEELDRRNVQASMWRPLLHRLVGAAASTAGNRHTGRYMRIPALDPAAFEELATDLASCVLALDYLTSFESLLAGRIQRIEQALMDQNREKAITALMSLQASAAMAGARQLQASATRVLADGPVEATLTGPLVRKLQGQADLFRGAFADFRDHRFTFAV